MADRSVFDDGEKRPADVAPADALGPSPPAPTTQPSTERLTSRGSSGLISVLRVESTSAGESADRHRPNGLTGGLQGPRCSDPKLQALRDKRYKIRIAPGSLSGVRKVAREAQRRSSLLFLLLADCAKLHIGNTEPVALTADAPSSRQFLLSRCNRVSALAERALRRPTFGVLPWF
jgi:hypothetical protein